MDVDPDFRAEMRIDEVREYGVGPLYPDYIGDAITFAKTRSAQTLAAKSREVAALLLRLSEETKPQNESVRAHLKPHLKRVYAGKNFPLLRKLLEMSIDRTPSLQSERGNILTIVTKLIQGFKQTGDLQPSGFWKRLPMSQILEKKREALSARPERTRQPPTGPHWASEDLIENMWAQRDKRITQGIWHEAAHDAIGRIGAAKAFPVCKNGKTRVFKDGNPDWFQYKQHIRADTTKEMEIRDSIRIRDELLQRSHSVELFGTPQPLGPKGWGQEPDFDCDDGSEYGFNPQMAKDDMEALYYQSGVQDPSLNAIWFPVPFSVSHPRDDDRPLPPPATEQASSSRDPAPPLPMDLLARSRDDKFPRPQMAFGTTHSDQAFAAGLASAVQAKAKGKGKAKGPKAPVISPEKSEDQFANNQRLITVLGISYTWRDLNTAEVTVEDRTAQECLKMGQTFLAKALDQWRADAFHKLVKRVKERASLMGSIRGMQDAARRVAPTVVSRLDSLSPIIHGYTDAAIDDAREANIAIEWARAAGRPVDLTPFNVRIGGFLNLAPADEMAFSCTLTTVPHWVRDVSIGVLEALAARVFVDFFKEHLKKKFLVLHVDNLGDVFSLCRNSSRSVTIQRVRTAYHRVLEENNIGTHVTWVSTKRNIADVLTRASRTKVLQERFGHLKVQQLQESVPNDPRVWGEDLSVPSTCLG
eukprot:g15927.t1